MTYLVPAVEELKQVVTHQRVIEAAGTLSAYFAGLDPLQMAEVGTAAIPFLPDMDYLLDTETLS